MNAKAASQRYQRQVLELAKQPGNDFCADCKARNPRWASHNLGIFVCMSCAGIHRKMGTHVSKIKSLTLDEWNKEQVERMREMGNVKSNAYYNPDEKRNRPPTNAEETERDSELERFVRDKYQRRRFIGKLPPPVPVKGPDDLRRSQSPMPPASPRHPSQQHQQQQQAGRPTMPRSSSSSSSLSPADGIARSRTAPIVPSTWREAKRAASPLPALPDEARESSKAKPPAISISTAAAAAAQPASALSASTSASSSLYPTTPVNLPPRASSAQGIAHTANGNQYGAGSSSATPVSPNAPFEGRSSVFDDLLSLTKPQEQQAQQLGGMAFGQAQYQQQQQAAMMGMGNPWAHMQQQQQQQQQPFQQMGAMQTGFGGGYGGGGYGGNFAGMDASGLGNMAFGGQMQQPQQQMMMGGQHQQAMMTGYPGGYAAPPSPSNPFFQQQQQQHQQAQYYGQQPVDPYAARDAMAQQRLQSGQVFDDWAKGMMPGTRGGRPGGA